MRQCAAAVSYNYPYDHDCVVRSDSLVPMVPHTKMPTLAVKFISLLTISIYCPYPSAASNLIQAASNVSQWSDDLLGQLNTRFDFAETRSSVSTVLTPNPSSSNSSQHIASNVTNGSQISQPLALEFHNADIRSVQRKSRATGSRPIDYCPQGGTLLYSQCYRAHSTQAWSSVCHTPHNGNTLAWGVCSEGEICIDDRLDRPMTAEGYANRTAWCVRPTAVVSLMTLLWAGGTAEAPYDAQATGNSSIEAVLTSSDSQSLIGAGSIQLEAQTSVNTGGSGTWRTLPGGQEHCDQCSNLGLPAVPQDTQRIQVSVEGVPASDQNGRLYLASIQH